MREERQEVGTNVQLATAIPITEPGTLWVFKIQGSCTCKWRKEANVTGAVCALRRWARLGVALGAVVVLRF